MSEVDGILARIQREAGAPDLLEVLAERLAPTDLQSLLLEVYRRRAGRVSPRRLLEQYAANRFVRPAELDVAGVAELDRLAWTALPAGYIGMELSPLCPLGTNAAVASVDQNKVVSTERNTEVVADATNVLALECACRRRRLLKADPRSRDPVRLAASHRVVRAQAYTAPGAVPHFRLFALCAAGRGEGSFAFETAHLMEQIAFYLSFFGAARRLTQMGRQMRVAVTDLDGGVHETALQQDVLAPLSARFPDAVCHFDRERAGGRGYYTATCFHIYVMDASGRECEVVDGGFTNWGQRLISNRKERLLISGLGMERLYRWL